MYNYDSNSETRNNRILAVNAKLIHTVAIAANMSKNNNKNYYRSPRL